MSDYNNRALNRIEPDYLGHYGLKEAPFADTRDARFTYLDAERAQRLNLLQHMTQYSNLLLMVVADNGVGKTTLMDRFMQQAQPDWMLCQIDANTMMDAEHLLYETARGFGLDSLPNSATQLQEALYRHLADLQHGHKVPLLIIDDGHLLSKEALLAIFHLADAQAEDGNLVRVIMFCEPDIEKILNSADVRALRERVTHTMSVPPLSEEDTAQYLSHRMAVAGFEGDSPFTPKVVHKIYKASNGVPQAINELAHMTLEQGDTAEVPTLTAPVRPREKTRPAFPRRAHVAWGGAALVLLAVVLVYQSEINALFEETPAPQELALKDALQSELEPPPADEPASAPVQEKIIPLQDPPPSPPPPDQQSTQSGPLQPAPQADPRQQQPVNEPGREQAAVPVEESGEGQAPTSAEESDAAAESPAPRIDAVEPNPVPASRQAQTIAIHGEGFAPDTVITLTWPGNEKTLSESQVDFQSPQQVNISITVGTDPDTWQVRVANPGAQEAASASFRVAAPQQPQSPATSPAPQGEAWIRAQNASDYTLQLFASRSRDNALRFVEQHSLGQTTALFPGRKDDAIWYSVVSGSYGTRDQAEQAAQNLPPSLSAVRPWIRRFADIQGNLVESLPADSRPPEFTSGQGESITDNEAWLWSQDPRHYTLQLLGARSAQSVRQFVAEHGIGDKAAYFHSRHEGGDWYVVVYGVYEDRQAAQQAIDRLPASLKNTSPWIRRLDSVHAELADRP